MKREYDDKDINQNIHGIDIEDDIEGTKELSINEWDVNDDEEIQEFLSRDFDVVSESRRRLQNRQNNTRKRKEERADRGERLVNKSRAKQDESFTRNKRTSAYNNDENDNDDVGKKAGLYDKWINIYHAHSMEILFGTLTVLIACLIVAIVVTYTSDDETFEADTTTNTVDMSTTDNLEDTKPVIEPEAETSDIHTLIVGYIDAAYIKADMEAVALVVDDTTNINVDKYKSRKKYIEQYENIKCYKFESAIDNAYIVFVTYDTKLYNIVTLAPSAETFIVKYNDAEKKYMIHNLTVEEELDSYIAGASEFAYTIEIRKDIEERLNQALATDTELKKVYDLMISTTSQTTEGTTSSTSTDGGATEQTTAK